MKKANKAKEEIDIEALLTEEQNDLPPVEEVKSAEESVSKGEMSKKDKKTLTVEDVQAFLKENPEIAAKLTKEEKSEVDKAKGSVGDNNQIAQLIKGLSQIIGTQNQQQQDNALTASQKVQSTMHRISIQGEKNLAKFKKELADSTQRREFKIDLMYATHIPVITEKNKRGIPVKIFKIGYNGVIFNIELGITYKDMPLVVVREIERVIAQYLGVVKGKDNSNQKVPFDMDQIAE